MFAILIISSLVILITTVLQYKEQSKDYNYKRLERKEKSLRESINSVLRRTTYPLTTENIPLIFKDEIHQIANIHNLNFELYDLDGRMLISSVSGLGKDTVVNFIHPGILDKLSKTSEKKLRVEEKNIKGDFISAYSYITDFKYKPLAVLHIIYESKSEFYEREMQEFLARLGKVYIFLILLAVVITFLISKNITKSLSVISEKLKTIDIEHNNQKLQIKNLPDELMPLIEAYNQMVDKLETSTKRLIKMEKESAWGEMARQVAHEIKNPLTPMRLTIEHFIQTYNPDNPDNEEKIKQFGEMLLEQIDALNKIAQSFSDYTKISDLTLEYDNIVDTVRNAVMLFPNRVKLESAENEIYTYFDKTRIKQALINIIRNAIQAAKEDEELQVVVKVYRLQSKVFIEVIDNGTGISDDVLERIFEPRFTTKSSGTGLGLSIVKKIIESHQGDILIETNHGVGTKFILILPIKEQDNEV
jgi:signal transduction histidine kinase